jgi:hypothetical protein
MCGPDNMFLRADKTCPTHVIHQMNISRSMMNDMDAVCASSCAESELYTTTEECETHCPNYLRTPPTDTPGFPPGTWTGYHPLYNAAPWRQGESARCFGCILPGPAGAPAHTYVMGPWPSLCISLCENYLPKKDNFSDPLRCKPKWESVQLGKNDKLSSKYYNFGGYSSEYGKSGTAVPGNYEPGSKCGDLPHPSQQTECYARVKVNTAFKDGCTCKYLPNLDEMSRRYRTGDAVVHGNENAWIRFDSFETMDVFRNTNRKRVRHFSSRSVFERGENLHTPGAPYNTMYQSAGLWREIHALEVRWGLGFRVLWCRRLTLARAQNLRYIGAFFTTIATLPVLVLDATLQTLHIQVELLNAVISPPYTSGNVPSVCAFDQLGGSEQSRSPTGGSGKRTVKPSSGQSGKIAQLIQCMGASLFKIAQMWISHVFTYVIGVMQSLQVLLEYWVRFVFSVVCISVPKPKPLR